MVHLFLHIFIRASGHENKCEFMLIVSTALSLLFIYCSAESESKAYHKMAAHKDTSVDDTDEEWAEPLFHF